MASTFGRVNCSEGTGFVKAHDVTCERPGGMRVTSAVSAVPIDKIRDARPGKHTKNDGKSPFFMGKSTITMAIFNSKLLVYQRVNSKSPIKMSVGPALHTRPKRLKRSKHCCWECASGFAIWQAEFSLSCLQEVAWCYILYTLSALLPVPTTAFRKTTQPKRNYLYHHQVAR